MFFLYTEDYIYRALTGHLRTENSPQKRLKIISWMIFPIQLIILLSYAWMWVITKIPIIRSITETICISYARGSLGFLLRGLFYKTQLKKMGVNVFIDRGATIIDPQYVEIGSNTYIDTNVEIYGGLSKTIQVKIGDFVHIAHDCIIAGRAGVEIGDYTGIAASSRIYSATHHYKKANSDEFVIISPLVALHEQCLLVAPIIIKEHVFIGFGSIVFPGVILETGCVIGALSMVKSSVPAFVVAVGAPLKIINTRPKPQPAL